MTNHTRHPQPITRDEWHALSTLKLELIEGNLCALETPRLALLRLLLKNVGLDAAIRLAPIMEWAAALGSRWTGVSLYSHREGGWTLVAEIPPEVPSAAVATFSDSVATQFGTMRHASPRSPRKQRTKAQEVPHAS